jgi:hypothetical protein
LENIGTKESVLSPTYFRLAPIADATFLESEIDQGAGTNYNTNIQVAPLPGIVWLSSIPDKIVR